MKGVLNLYKPRGITSSAAVVSVRKILGVKAIGHMGTLDPAGEGVLLLGVGKATRLFDHFLHKDKVYTAEFCFGYVTDTLDGDGTVTQTTDVIPDRAALTAILPQFIGKQQQIPPQYSAKSVHGVRAYALAREGKTVALPPCEVEIYSLECTEQTGEYTYRMQIHCSSGTYIRSLCRDIAAALGSLATMVSIKRLRCGPFTAENSVTLDRLAQEKENALVPLCEALNDLPVVRLSDELFAPLCNGIKIPCEQKGEFLLYCRGELFGIARAEKRILKIKTYLRD